MLGHLGVLKEKSANSAKDDLVLDFFLPVSLADIILAFPGTVQQEEGGQGKKSPHV